MEKIMHFYMMTRGIKRRVDELISDLQAQYFRWKKKPTDPEGMLQLSIRPIQLWEVVFPKEQHDEVMGMLQPGTYGSHKTILWDAEMFALRKMLQCEPMRDYVNTPEFRARPRRFVNNADVEIIPIGIKEDVVVEGEERL